MKNFIIRMIQGAIVGTGAILPGISGGVLAVAFGIYEPMMEFISHPFKTFKKHFKFFIPIVIGAALGFVLLAGIVEKLFQASATITTALFAGLIFGTIPGLIKESIAAEDTKSFSPMIISLVFSFIFFKFLENTNTVTIAPSMLWFFISGVIWGISLVIPGISSSAIILVLGLYIPMTKGIASLDMRVIIPLFLGIGITVLLTARIVYKFLKTKYGLFSKIVIGIMLSSTILITPFLFKSVLEFIISLIVFILGFWGSRWMDTKKEKNNG